MEFKKKYLCGRFKRLYDGLVHDESNTMCPLVKEYDNLSLKDTLKEMEEMDYSCKTIEALYDYLLAMSDKDNDLEKEYLNIKSALGIIYNEKSGLVHNLKVLKKYIDCYNELLDEYNKM